MNTDKAFAKCHCFLVMRKNCDRQICYYCQERMFWRYQFSNSQSKYTLTFKNKGIQTQWVVVYKAASKSLRKRHPCQWLNESLIKTERKTIKTNQGSDKRIDRRKVIVTK